MFYAPQHYAHGDKTTDTKFRVGRGAPRAGDAIWLRGPVATPPMSNGGKRRMAMEWDKRHEALAGHVEYMTKHAKTRQRLHDLQAI